MSFNINNRRYTGSKHKLCNWICNIINKEAKDCKSFCDLFAGTGALTAQMINKFKIIYINDFLFSNEIIYKAFFLNKPFSLEKIIKYTNKFKNIKPEHLSENYFSRNFGNKYFSKDDAKIIGWIRENIEKAKNKLNEKEYAILIASLIYSVDRIANTVGHYESYLKRTNFLSIFKYELIKPILPNDELCDVDIRIFRKDSNFLSKKIKADVVYVDPPYSSRQYSRFYHLLENLTKWQKPKLYGSALKPKPENLSKYSTSKAIDTFTDLIASLDCKYIFVSYNNTYNSRSNSSKNKMSLKDILFVLNNKGKTLKYEKKYIPFNSGKTKFKNHKEFLFATKVGK